VLVSDIGFKSSKQIINITFYFQQSRYFDAHHNKSLSPRFQSPVVELKQKGQIVVINVKKDKDNG